MSIETSIYDDCYLLIDINLNSQRIASLFERRFQSNSTKLSFDFKLLPPEQPSNNAKVSRSLLRFQPKLTHINDYDENITSDSSLSSSEDDGSDVDDDDNDGTKSDDYLDKLAEWDSEECQPITQFTNDDDNDDDDDDDDNIIESTNKERKDKDCQITPMDQTIETNSSSSDVEDLVITYCHRPPKSEPISSDDNIFDNFLQLDGQIDIQSNTSSKQKNTLNREKNLSDVIAKVIANTTAPKQVIQLHKIPPPPVTNKFRLTEKKEKKMSTDNVKRSSNSTKQRTAREPKPLKKIQSKLLSNVLKGIEEVPRPLTHRVSSTSCDTQKAVRSLSNNQESKLVKSVSHNERKSALKQMKTSSITKTRDPLNVEKSATIHMKLAQNRLNDLQNEEGKIVKQTPVKSNSVELKKTAITNKSKQKVRSLSQNKNTIIKEKEAKLKRLNHEKSKSKSISTSNIFIFDEIRNQVTGKSQTSLNQTIVNEKTNKRSNDFFEGCIVIDNDELNNEITLSSDDDNDEIQEIQTHDYSIFYDIRTREKLLDHAVHSISMRMKWLFNLEYLLLEHILICHEKNIRPFNKIYQNSLTINTQLTSETKTYQIHPKFISIIIINFIKMFILRNINNDEQEVSFVQFGITSHLRYLLIELPTYKHNEDKDSTENCHQCHQYSLIINILFDILFDLIEYDLCEEKVETKYRSSLIEGDYFTYFRSFNSKDKNKIYRIKLIIYFIELIGIHMNKCTNKKQFQFNQNEDKLFHSIEKFIQRILFHIKTSINEKLSICFNVMELCLLFVNKKHLRIKQMALFLADLYQVNSAYRNLFLFDKSLFVDIRLLLINELISRMFNLKFHSINSFNEIFEKIQNIFNLSSTTHPIDDSLLLLIRSLFETYADLNAEIKTLPFMYSINIQQLKSFLRNKFDLVYRKLIEVSSIDENYFKQMKRTLILYRLLKFRWNQL